MNPILLKQISEDRALASAVLFSHRHRQATPPFHIDIMDYWRSADEMVVIEVFREGAKTTLAEEFLTIEALFGNFRYAIIIGETYTKACQRIEGIKYELVTNAKIHSLFGKQRGSTWSENKIVLPNGVCVEAHGWEEEFRGYLYLNHRPDRVYLDDVENKTNTQNTDSVDRGWKKIHMEILPAMDTELGKIRITGTPLADDCLITRASRSPHWLHLKVPIMTSQIPAWPERYSLEWILNKQKLYTDEGMLREFNQEYMLIAQGSQGKPFSQAPTTTQTAPRGYAPKTLIIDPARTSNIKKSDQTGYVVVSKIGRKIYVHESKGEYWQPDQVINGLFDISSRHDDADVAIERNSLDDWLMQPLRAEMLKRGTPLTITPLLAPQDRDKDQFILGLQPLIISGDIIFVGEHQQLTQQITNFPSGKKDIINALAYIQRVFSGKPVYPDFSESNITSSIQSAKSISSLLLGLNYSSSGTTAILCTLEDSYIRVVADWASSGTPSELLPAVTMYLNAVYPGKQPSVWIPADSHDQSSRDPLMQAAKRQRWTPQRGEYSSLTRGCLTETIRTEIKGRRLFTVSSNAHRTLKAFAHSYQYGSVKGGGFTDTPLDNISRCLVEGLEIIPLTKTLNPVTFAPNAVNANGVPYYSAMGR